MSPSWCALMILPFLSGTSAICQNLQCDMASASACLDFVRPLNNISYAVENGVLVDERMVFAACSEFDKYTTCMTNVPLTGCDRTVGVAYNITQTIFSNICPQDKLIGFLANQCCWNKPTVVRAIRDCHAQFFPEASGSDLNALCGYKKNYTPCILSAVRECGLKTKKWVVDVLSVAFQTMEEDDVIKDVCDSILTGVTTVLTTEATHIPTTAATELSSTLITTVASAVATGSTCDVTGATSCLTSFSAEVQEVVSVASTISGSTDFNASLVAYVCKLYSESYSPCATPKIQNCSSSSSVIHDMLEHAFQFVCSPHNVANMLASVDCIGKSEVLSAVDVCTSRLQDDATPPVDMCRLITEFQLCVIDTVHRECSASIQPGISALLNHALSPVYRLFRCYEVPLPVPQNPDSPSTIPGSAKPIDIDQCDGACLTVMKDKLLEIGINTAAGDFVFSDVTTICPDFVLYRECVTPWYQVCPHSAMAAHDSLIRTFMYVCQDVYNDIISYNDCWTSPEVKYQFSVCARQMDESYALNQDSCMQQNIYKSCLLDKIKDVCAPRAGEILATYVHLAQSASCSATTTATVHATTSTNTTPVTVSTDRPPPTHTTVTSNTTTSTNTTPVTVSTDRPPPTHTTVTSNTTTSEDTTTTSTNGSAPECTVGTASDLVETSTQHETETENETATPSMGPIECYECNSGYYPSYQNVYCPVDGTLETWALSTSTCDGPCVSKTSKWNKGDVFRGCATNYYLPIPVARVGCHVIDGETWCFCNTDRCNSDAMDEFVDRD